MDRSPENLWLNAFMGLLTFSGVLVAANVAYAVVQPHYQFWTAGIMIGAYIVGALAVTCYFGALRQWPVPLSGGRSQGIRLLPKSPRALAVDREVKPSSAADLAELGNQQIQVLCASIVILQNLVTCLTNLDSIPRPSVDYADACAQAQDLMNRTRTQLRTLVQQISDSAWPHREWALSFQVAERKAQQRIAAWQSPGGKKLPDSVANLLQLIAAQYPSLFKDEV